MNIELSVVIPVRNAEELIEECLASVVAAEPSEIIVVDGCSTDRTLDIVGRYGVRVLSDGGRGVAVARRWVARSWVVVAAVASSGGAVARVARLRGARPRSRPRSPAAAAVAARR